MIRAGRVVAYDVYFGIEQVTAYFGWVDGDVQFGVFSGFDLCAFDGGGDAVVGCVYASYFKGDASAVADTGREGDWNAAG